MPQLIVLWSLFFQISLLIFPAAVEALTTPPSVQADGAILMDSRTGEVLFDKNASASLAPASTTKIMTAILAIESGLLDQKTVISETAAQTEGSTIHLQAGQTYTLRDLLTGLLLRSGNDCAVAIAEAVAGSTEEFVHKMNSKAALLGAFDTRFQNPHGLPDKEHRSTAYDLAWITRYAMRLPEFSAIVNTRQTNIDFEDARGNPQDQELKNTNKLLWLLPEADGVKTGTTSEAGPCLVSSATKNGQQLIAVTLNDKKRWQDSRALLVWGFDNFALYEYEAEEADGVIRKLPVRLGMKEDVSVILKEAGAVVVEKQNLKKVKTGVELPEKLNAPVYQGQKIGALHFILDGQTIKSVDLEAAETVEERTFSRLILHQFSMLLRFLSQLRLI